MKTMEAKEKLKRRSLDEAVTALWQVIDEAKAFLTDPKSSRFPSATVVLAQVLQE